MSPLWVEPGREIDRSSFGPRAEARPQRSRIANTVVKVRFCRGSPFATPLRPGGRNVQLRTLAAAAALMLVPALSSAQDFGVMNSAETINEGNVKLMASPMFVFGEGDDETGVAISAGYGFTDRFDIEGRVAFYDGINFFGADAEYWLVRDEEVDVSVAGGFHLGRADGPFDLSGFDFTFLASGHVTPRLELYGGFDIATNEFDDDLGDYTTVHLVPGIEYAINEDLDLVSEFGVAVNDESNNYFSVGLAFYFR
jgi:hypothetical protein